MVLYSFVIRRKALYSVSKEKNYIDDSNFELLIRVCCTLAGDPLKSHVEITQNMVFNVTNCMWLALYRLKTIRVVSPTLNVNLTLFVILYKQKDL
jgi:hypothetical protein